MTHLLDHVGPFLLVAFRLSGVMLAAPLMASVVIPMKVRALLILALAATLYPAIPPASQAFALRTDLDLYVLGWAVMGEVFIGYCIGLLAMLPVAAVQLAGMIMGLQMGFGLASIVNPALETETEPIGEMLTYLALYVFIMIGGLEAAFIAAANTFAHTPPGAFHAGGGLAPINLITGIIASGMELAMRVSLPLMGIVLMETVATAFLAKTLPTLNLMSVGFAVKIVIGLLALVVGLRAIDDALAGHVSETLRQVLFWSSDPRGA